ncbi:cysteine desulfurase / selenocysteine lyase [Candidatus Planktophila vernalis]|uniref:Cysteine desulfurase n=1 Tax=Candidatus Planktophila vernalis TaxID=1884907 RepID=A0A249KT75_9ACTN|nr:cysteine desulfurase [Candidatus Planktophila vernalis]ASY20018.1 cysteine desulfurase / selenocysteine lyase [Candidatus Planktophila vernalis]
MSFSVANVRRDFPIFERTIRDGKRLVYLDSGATSQKPWAVINAESDFYSKHNAAVHRGAHQLAEEATDAYEGARAIVAEFLGAQDNEIIFTKSATESINAVAYAMGNAEPGNRFALTASDSIVVTEMEHHANLIPWQQLAKRTGAQLKWFKVNQDSRLDLSNIDQVITANTRVVALTHQSNVLGTINPLGAIVKRAREVGAVVVLDACQSVPHMRVNVVDLDVDFLAFSGHKSVGPTGVGILWGKAELLSELPPFLTGGSMVTAVTMESATWAEAPQKFEAGVPNMAQAVGLGAALNYLSNIGMDAIAEHERSLTGYALDKLLQIPGLRIVGPQDNVDRGAALSFTIKDIHPHDVGQYVDSQGIAVRTGHHCAWPLTKIMNVPATTRASFYLYNDEHDVDALVEALLGAQKYFGKF